MVRGMTTKKFNSRHKFLRRALFISFFLFTVSFHSFSESGDWVLSAIKFTVDGASSSDGKSGKNAEDIVNATTAEMLPVDILENISTSVVRNVIPDEQFERTKYKLKTERQSLFLQLSSEYKKRDSLVINNYSEYKFKTALAEEQKKISDIQKKIDENLKTLKNETEKNQQKMEAYSQLKENGENQDSKNQTDLARYKNIFQNWFTRKDSIVTQENLKFYRDNFENLYLPPEEIKKLPYSDPLYASYVTKAGINSLITGHFKKYGDYISVYVDLYLYPAGVKIGSIAEVGNINDLEFLTTNIAMQLIPMLSNSLPVQLDISIEPQEVAEDVEVYIDETLQKIVDNTITIDSGIHTIQFVSPGYKSVSTNYSFEGNRKYKIEVALEKPKFGYLQLGLKKPLEGDILMNGEHALKVNEKKSQIAINGNKILGEFISENGETAFFYVPERLTFDGSYVTINPKPRDRMSYIDKRRKIMYASYSIFMISLIPTFYTHANFTNYATLYKNYMVDYQTAKKWQDASNISRVISLGCGLFWGYELVRYLIAANSVLPQTARAGKAEEFSFYEPVKEENETAAENADNADIKNNDSELNTETSKNKNGENKK